MQQPNRRKFLNASALGLGALVAPVWMPAWAANGAASKSPQRTSRRVVVVGGGFGGTIAAKTIRLLDPGLEVVLIEPNQQLVCAPQSNLVLGGVLPDLTPLTRSYDALAARHGVTLVHDRVSAINPARKTVAVGGKSVAYERLVLSPGIDFKVDAIHGYHPDSTSALMPHAWTTGAQTTLLRRQLTDMADGGTVLITVPGGQMRYRVGAYERASLIAAYLKQAKPRSKVLVLDANPDIAELPELFKSGWASHYPGLVEYRGGQKLLAVNERTRSVTLDGQGDIRGDVVNLIPPQRAGRIALASGLAGPGKDWCPVQVHTFESTLQPHIHVLGDACDAGAMPKSGFAANGQAKACAINLVALMNGQPLTDFSGIDTSFSYLSATEAASQIGVYRAQGGRIVAVPDAGGASASWSQAEATYAASWRNNILHEMLE